MRLIWPGGLEAAGTNALAEDVADALHVEDRPLRERARALHEAMELAEGPRRQHLRSHFQVKIPASTFEKHIFIIQRTMSEAAERASNKSERRQIESMLLRQMPSVVCPPSCRAGCRASALPLPDSRASVSGRRLGRRLPSDVFLQRLTYH